MNNTGSQAVRMMHDVEMETNAVNVNHACSQMELERDEKEISCQILVPEEESPADLVDCFKCLGTQTNKKGMPCRKCNGTGSIASKELAEVSGLIKEQVTSYCQSAFRDMLKSHLKQKRED